MKSKIDLKSFAKAWVPIGVVVLVWILRELLRVGVWDVARFQWQIFLKSVLFMLGGIGGVVLANFPDYFGKLLSRFSTLSPYLQAWKMSTRNILTATILVIFGMWLFPSSGNVFAWGMLFILEFVLFRDYVDDESHESWFAIFSRSYGEVGYRAFLIIWIAALLAQFLIIARS